MNNRIYKFRVYDRKKQKMFSVMCLYNEKSVEYRDGLSIARLNKSDGDDFDIMQYTSFKDKNNKEIYEGDIVRCDDQHCAVVVWKRDGFILDFFDNVKNIPSLWYNVESSEIEVIGNIYENPELIIYLSDDL